MDAGTHPIQLVGALIFRNGRLLIVRRSLRCRILPGYWDTPGGHVEPGETLTEALHREVQEETGLSIRIDGPSRTTRYELPDGRAEEHDFLCEIDGPSEIVLDPSEHTSFEWITPEGVEREPATPEMRAIWCWAFERANQRRA